MVAALKSLLLVQIVTSLVDFGSCQAEGGKAHFQVHNKMQGMLNIVASKTQATVINYLFLIPNRLFNV